MKFMLRILVLSLAVGVATLTAGALVNAGFETGDFMGWVAGGDANIVTSYSGIGPLAGSWYALVGAGPLDPTTVEAALGLSSGTLSIWGPTGGSYIYQTVASQSDFLAVNSVDQPPSSVPIDSFRSPSTTEPRHTSLTGPP